MTTASDAKSQDVDFAGDGVGRRRRAAPQDARMRSVVRPDDLLAASMPSASALVVAHVRNAIRRGDLMPGERLREVKLAESCAVSRSSIREAFRTLAADGVITLSARRSAIVRHFSRREIRAHYEVREALEGLAASFAATRCGDAVARDRLRRLFAGMEACAAGKAVADYMELNQQLHQLIIALSDNSFIRECIDRAQTASLRLQAAPRIAVIDIAKLHGEHRVIVEAILRQDAVGAEAAMRRHIRGGLERILTLPDEFFAAEPAATVV